MKEVDDKTIGIGALALLGIVYMLVTGAGGNIPTGVITSIATGIAGLVTGRAMSK